MKSSKRIVQPRLREVQKKQDRCDSTSRVRARSGGAAGLPGGSLMMGTTKWQAAFSPPFSKMRRMLLGLPDHEARQVDREMAARHSCASRPASARTDSTRAQTPRRFGPYACPVAIIFQRERARCCRAPHPQSIATVSHHAMTCARQPHWRDTWPHALPPPRAGRRD